MLLHLHPPNHQSSAQEKTNKKLGKDFSLDHFTRCCSTFVLMFTLSAHLWKAFELGM